jgi:hypothetical protein
MVRALRLLRTAGSILMNSAVTGVRSGDSALIICRAPGGIVLPRRGAWRSGAQGSREGEAHLRPRGGNISARTSP